MNQAQLLQILTFLVFLTLKLTGHINWSWWLVTAPLWAMTALLVALKALAKFLHWLEYKLASPEERTRIKLRQELERIQRALPKTR